MARSDTSPARSIDWDRLRGDVRAAAAAFADQLRAIPDGSARVPNLEWDVRELAAHLVSLPGFYEQLNVATEPFEDPDSWPDFSRGVRAHLADLDTSALAAMIEPETDRLLTSLGENGEATWTLYLETTAAKVAAGYLSELLLHGMDLGALTGATVDITTDQGHDIVAGMMTLAPAFVDPEAARKCPGVYHLRFRGGNDYTYRVADGTLTVEDGRPERPDAHVVADPVAFALVAMGRMSQARAGLTGRVMAYGRRPWKLIQLGKVRVEGI